MNLIDWCILSKNLNYFLLILTLKLKDLVIKLKVYRTNCLFEKPGISGTE
jgi:hypothetical protein